MRNMNLANIISNASKCLLLMMLNKNIFFQIFCYLSF